MTIGEKLKEIRLSKNLSQREFSSKIGTDIFRYARIETDNSIPELAMLMLASEGDDECLQTLLDMVNNHKCTNCDSAMRVNELEDLLEISPYGDNRIDQLEDVIKYKDEEIKQLKKKILELTNMWING